MLLTALNMTTRVATRSIIPSLLIKRRSFFYTRRFMEEAENTEGLFITRRTLKVIYRMVTRCDKLG
jgi:hypothetical protein